MATQRLMKDALDRQAIARLGSSLLAAYPSFALQQFEKTAFKGLQQLELKQRVKHLIRAMHQHLPADFRETASILGLLKQHWHDGNEDDVWRSFAAWPAIDYVAEYGLEHPKQSLDTLKILTPLFTAEFAIRPFIVHHFDYTWKQLEQWCNNRDEHVRRLVSEGTRPRLPWGMQLKMLVNNPRPVLPLLEQLRDDSSEYVRRSVANNLNDISKDHPELVIRTGKQWLKNAGSERQWIIRHATRTLVKQGHAGAFSLLGYSSKVKIKPVTLKLARKTVSAERQLEFTATVTSAGNRSQRLLIDYAVHFVRANGTQSAKVFKLKKTELQPGESVKISKQHSFRPVTTRRYYPGCHRLVLMINGREVAQADFSYKD